jgi:hypothetical protein
VTDGRYVSIIRSDYMALGNPEAVFDAGGRTKIFGGARPKGDDNGTQ